MAKATGKTFLTVNGKTVEVEVLAVYPTLPDAWESLSAGLGRFKAFQCIEAMTGELPPSVYLDITRCRFDRAMTKYRYRKLIERMDSEIVEE